jgi:hypothetical protein
MEESGNLLFDIKVEIVVGPQRIAGSGSEAEGDLLPHSECQGRAAAQSGEGKP